MSAIALQSSPAAIEPRLYASRAQIIDRYRKFREISKRHHSGAVRCMSRDAILEQARRLGVARGRKLILNTEDELALVFDLALYARQGGRKRPIDRYASSQSLLAESDEALVLEAMLAARFALIRVERRRPEAGLILSDLLSKEEFWLVDEGMESTAPVGLTMATRVFAPEDFHLSAGVFVPLNRSLLLNALLRRPRLARLVADEAVEDRRFAEAIYREAIHEGVMETINFQETPRPSDAA